VRAGEWSVIEAAVTAVDARALRLDAGAHGGLLVEGQSWAYAQEHGFTARPGDILAISGFQEAGEFKADILTHRATGQEVILRDRDGWPLWGGRYR